jgi:hypothetical protein
MHLQKIAKLSRSEDTSKHTHNDTFSHFHIDACVFFVCRPIAKHTKTLLESNVAFSETPVVLQLVYRQTGRSQRQRSSGAFMGPGRRVSGRPNRRDGPCCGESQPSPLTFWSTSSKHYCLRVELSLNLRRPLSSPPSDPSHSVIPYFSDHLRIYSSTVSYA